MSTPSTDLEQRSARRPFQVCKFRINDNSVRRPHGRSRFSPQKRAKVHGVRRRKACLRCKALKIPVRFKYYPQMLCSGGDPCDTCLALTRRPVQSAALTWSYCIRTKFREVSIFIGERDHSAVSAGLALLDSHEPTLSFDISWDRSSLVQTVMDWLLQDDDSLPPSKSLVGAFSSKQFATLAAENLDHEFVAGVRTLLYATSKAHVRRNQAHPYDSNLVVREMDEAAYFTGTRVIEALDDVLSPQSLASASRATLETIFLVLVSITLAIGYSTQICSSPLFKLHSEEVHLGRSTNLTLWEVMRQHVCEMLSHYIILVASKLQVRFRHAFQRELIISATARWGKKATFTWADPVLDHSSRWAIDHNIQANKRLCFDDEMVTWECRYNNWGDAEELKARLLGGLDPALWTISYCFDTGEMVPTQIGVSAHIGSPGADSIPGGHRAYRTPSTVAPAQHATTNKPKRRMHSNAVCIDRRANANLKSTCAGPRWLPTNAPNPMSEQSLITEITDKGIFC
ncbi:hypothetical protein B0H66DRAFT_528958 [Apodospora peruviana]|uniref:Uncharacterized protein n=1 Tax=Apodospora peruviana TaxID=516989 RepID=A0AAE0MBG2_9PEZI|nr:hypothetical protein B0H66DRAFT_528958 [Apodospora peruviana]